MSVGELLLRCPRNVTGWIAITLVLSCILLNIEGEGNVRDDTTIPANVDELISLLMLFPVRNVLETSLLSLAVTVVGLLCFAIPTEETMGHRAVLQYLLVVAAVGVPIVNVLRPTLFPYASSYGGWPALEAMLVAQCYTRGLGTLAWPLPPATTDSTTPTSAWRRAMAKVRVRHLPLLTGAVALVLDMVAIAHTRDRTSQALDCLLGAAVGWGYLRYSWAGVESVTSFAFTELLRAPPLPRPVETFVNRVVGRPVFGNSGLSGGGADAESAASPAGIPPVLFASQRTGGQVLLPGSTPEEAERRRAIALAALSRRLQEQQQQQQQQQQSSQSPAPAATEHNLDPSV